MQRVGADITHNGELDASHGKEAWPILAYLSLEYDSDAGTSCSWENHPKAVKRMDCEHLQPTQAILAKGA